MRAGNRKITDMTVDELKDVIHEAIAEDMEVWRETFEIMADSKLMAQLTCSWRNHPRHSQRFISNPFPQPWSVLFHGLPVQTQAMGYCGLSICYMPCTVRIWAN